MNSKAFPRQNLLSLHVNLLSDCFTYVMGKPKRKALEDGEQDLPAKRQSSKFSKVGKCCCCFLKVF